MWDEWLTKSKPVMPVIVIDDIDTAVPMAQALVAGGVKLLEVTLRTPAALACQRRLSVSAPLRRQISYTLH